MGMTPRHQVSKAAVELIKKFEGYRSKAAQLPDGRWTIGFGHTLTAREGAQVSEQDAEALLLYDLIAVALETFQKDMEAAQLPPLAGGSTDTPAPASAAPSGVSVESMDGMSRDRCPVCEERAVIREEGCLKCQACGYSKCG